MKTQDQQFFSKKTHSSLSIAPNTFISRNLTALTQKHASLEIMSKIMDFSNKLAVIQLIHTRANGKDKAASSKALNLELTLLWFVKGPNIDGTKLTSDK